MALGYLFLAFVVMSIIALVGILLLFLLKSIRVGQILLVLLTLYSLMIAFISANAQPVNFIATRVFAWIIGLIAVAGTLIYFITRKHHMLCKVMVALSVIVGIIALYFI